MTGEIKTRVLLCSVLVLSHHSPPSHRHYDYYHFHRSVKEPVSTALRDGHHPAGPTPPMLLRQRLLVHY
jgi:hypothetical protein